jgi:hypothetical protein
MSGGRIVEISIGGAATGQERNTLVRPTIEGFLIYGNRCTDWRFQPAHTGVEGIEMKRTATAKH